MLAPPPRDAGGKTFYQDHDRVVRRAEEMAALGFDWIALNATAIFQAGARSVDAIVRGAGRRSTTACEAPSVDRSRRPTGRGGAGGRVLALLPGFAAAVEHRSG